MMLGDGAASAVAPTNVAGRLACIERAASRDASSNKAGLNGGMMRADRGFGCFGLPILGAQRRFRFLRIGELPAARISSSWTAHSRAWIDRSAAEGMTLSASTAQ